jgi:hypothetical protein
MSSASIKRDPHSEVPLLHKESNFFNYFDDDKVYDSVFDDLKTQQDQMMEGSSLPKYQPKKKHSLKKQRSRRQSRHATDRSR